MDRSLTVRFLLLFAATATFLSAADSSPAQIAAESAKANTFFERVFDETVARSPMTMTQLGLKTDNDKWDDLSEQKELEDFLLGVQQLAELKRTINLDRKSVV